MSFFQTFFDGVKIYQQANSFDEVKKYFSDIPLRITHLLFIMHSFKTPSFAVFTSFCFKSHISILHGPENSNNKRKKKNMVTLSHVMYICTFIFIVINQKRHNKTIPKNERWRIIFLNTCLLITMFCQHLYLQNKPTLFDALFSDFF